MTRIPSRFDSTMNAVPAQEPLTFGKVRLQTNKGELIIELWSRECPKACRNFVQLCMEGYYDGTLFHRVIPGFVVQGGDPTGTGNGGDSIYGESFPDEIHSRLRFRYRGILGVANAGKGTKTNGSQFFITLDKQETLTGLHTMFGKVVGNSIYTLSNLIENVELDKSDRPIGSTNLPRIISAEVLDNPFPDIVPRLVKKPSSSTTKSSHVQSKSKLVGKRSGVLSFKSSSDQPDQIQNKRPPSEPIDTTPSNPKDPPSVQPPVKQSSGSSKLQSEIEKLQKQILAAATGRGGGPKVGKSHHQSKPPPPQPAVSEGAKKQRIDHEDHADDDSQHALEMKFKNWSRNLHASSNRSDEKLQTSAESGDWLKSVSSLKFAIDSKTAFSKTTSET